MVLGPDFSRILKAAKAGAEWAWAAIYRDLAGPVRGYFVARGVREAEDLTGETFLQVFRDIASFQGEERPFRSWVFVIANRRLIDHHRAAAKRSQPPVCAEEALDVVGGNAEDEALEGLSTAEVLSALRQLTDDQRTVLALRVFGGLSAEEIAVVVGRRPGAVRATQYRGLRALQKILGEGE